MTSRIADIQKYSIQENFRSLFLLLERFPFSLVPASSISIGIVPLLAEKRVRCQRNRVNLMWEYLDCKLHVRNLMAARWGIISGVFIQYHLCSFNATALLLISTFPLVSNRLKSHFLGE